MAYDPSQPRVPAGSGDPSGQWSSSNATYRAKVEKSLGKDVQTTSLRYDKDKKRWVDKDGNPVDPRVLAIIEQANPSRAGTVTINPEPGADLLALVYPKAGGDPKYIYTKDHDDRVAAEKFARLQAFHEKLPAFRVALDSTLSDQSADSVAKDSAAALLLIERTGIRVGGGDSKNFGASTLQGKHVVVDGDRVSLRFSGKSSKENTREFNDPALAKYIGEKAAKVGPEGRLFSASDERMRADMKKTAGEYFTPKDMRTWHGTALAIEEVSKMPKPTNAKELHGMQITVAKTVASYLNNTPAVALKHYIDPRVFPSVSESRLEAMGGH